MFYNINRFSLPVRPKTTRQPPRSSSVFPEACLPVFRWSPFRVRCRWGWGGGGRHLPTDLQNPWPKQERLSLPFCHRVKCKFNLLIVQNLGDDEIYHDLPRILSFCLSLCLSVYLYVCMYSCLYFSVSICLSVLRIY